MERLHADPKLECYWRRDMPTSPGRFLLIRALERVCGLRHGHDLPLVALTFDDEGSMFVDDPARSQILKAARFLGEAFAAEDILTYARAFGGSAPSRLPASVWELDDFGRRFATSALDPLKPFDPHAVPSHWIFVDEEGLDRLLRSKGPVAALTTEDPDPTTVVATEAGVEPTSDRYVRMPELEARTGMSRATIYRRIKAGRFPRKVPMDGNVSVWREGDVAAWLANPR